MVCAGPGNGGEWWYRCCAWMLSFICHDGDVTDCKHRQPGLEYTGTASNPACLSWTDAINRFPHGLPIHDRDFPDGSVKAAANYCRNPTNPNYLRRGKHHTLWCYQHKDTPHPSPFDCSLPKLCGECFQPIRNHLLRHIPTCTHVRNTRSEIGAINRHHFLAPVFRLVGITLVDIFHDIRNTVHKTTFQ